MKINFVMKALALAGLTLTLAVSAHAQATRTWVSGVGDDANPCSRTAPCKTFAGAISKTTAGGEIDVLDPGGFGTLTVTKPITIDGGGGQVAGVTASGTVGFTVNAGSTGVVTLRNLSINALANSPGTPGTIGVNFVAGKQLVIENCKIFGFSTAGVFVQNATASQVLIKNSSLINNFVGLKINAASSPPSSATMDNVIVQGGDTGIDAVSGLVQLTGCTVTQAASYGLHAEGGTISIVKSLLTYNTTVAQSETASVIRLSDNDIYDNGVCFAYNGTGKILSASNNRKIGNASSANPTGPIPVQ